MSKKKKKFNKLKKKHQTQPYQNNQAHKTPIEKIDNNLEAKAASLPTESEADIKESVAKDIPTSIENEYAYVKKDIKKILLIMLSVIIILIVIYIVDLKTTLLDSFGDWVYKILNITTG